MLHDVLLPILFLKFVNNVLQSMVYLYLHTEDKSVIYTESSKCMHQCGKMNHRNVPAGNMCVMQETEAGASVTCRNTSKDSRPCVFLLLGFFLRFDGLSHCCSLPFPTSRFVEHGHHWLLFLLFNLLPVIFFLVLFLTPHFPAVSDLLRQLFTRFDLAHCML